ncbi:MAG: hypothetical protein NXH75_06475 [Halobacteriovoraceae bacterium]|nr:hypothetical protein [Halobacteriovoraceae bacterium]
MIKIKLPNTLLVLTLLFFTSCAGVKKKKPSGPKTYGADVEQEFSNIENDQKRVLEYYRTLRAKNWEAYKKSDEMVRRYNRNYSKKKKKGYTRYQKPKKRPPITTKKLAAPKPEPVPLPEKAIEEMKIEIRQHQSYYCMKNRKSSRFSNDADCSAYTEDVSNDCKKKYPIISDRSLVNCVKKGLR